DPILDTKVTFNADDATLSSVFKALSKLSNTNIVLSVEQAGTAEKEEKRVTINIKDVPVETAVSLVASSAGLSYRVIGSNTFLVGQKQNIMEEIGERSNIIFLNNLDAKKVSDALQNTSGKITPLEGQNALMVYGNPETFKEVEQLVKSIDLQQQQVEIRVRLIEVHINEAQQFGVDWSKLNHLTTILAEDPVNQYGTGLPYNYNDATGYLPHGDPTDFGVIPDEQYFQRINGFNDIGHFSRQLTAFDVTIDWLLENNAAQLLTDTRVTALNGELATMHIGEVVPFVVTDKENQLQVERSETGIILNVTPKVNQDGNITMNINPEVSSVTELVGGYIPRTKVRRVSSAVTVPNEHKIIVGGLLNSNITQKVNKLPLLGDLPLVGKIFQHRYELVENTDLIIEITPRLVSMQETSPTPKLDKRLTRTLIQYEEEEEE
ncbi:MAG TPA: secretin N-terminal domain-containing protein, partial [Candidatus Cloacimonas sp.]|nr:secretin N-terminal domain-containing protein [Candidatus Cloacimonas sp.]HPA24190.1 secretin N-terminal domain-containing protein [Candidatus Cloacimonas sp.]HQC31280.1 secretin N-terminal domain-containing protein [Candidatus Cloacimonas sp.]HQO46828.1 secretin N-terminal domain-containing protein [Candidatus Cloacimonas sp.]HQP32870.1 secretin N-terminal domain-containing protein [Candidatus Cloacimonas sp.]